MIVYALDSVGPFPAISEACHLIRLPVPFGNDKLRVILILIPFSNPTTGSQGVQVVPLSNEVEYSIVEALTPDTWSVIEMPIVTSLKGDTLSCAGKLFEYVTLSKSMIKVTPFLGISMLYALSIALDCTLYLNPEYQLIELGS